MEVSGQSNTSVAFPSGKEPMVPTEQDWTRRWREKNPFFDPIENRTPVVQPVALSL
jgi:hypothetical protein